MKRQIKRKSIKRKSNPYKNPFSFGKGNGEKEGKNFLNRASKMAKW